MHKACILPRLSKKSNIIEHENHNLPKGAGTWSILIYI